MATDNAQYRDLNERHNVNLRRSAAVSVQISHRSTTGKQQRLTSRPITVCSHPCLARAAPVRGRHGPQGGGSVPPARHKSPEPFLARRLVMRSTGGLYITWRGSLGRFRTPRGFFGSLPGAAE